MADNRSVLVVGLGRFGSAVATTLDAMGQDVLAVDRSRTAGLRRSPPCRPT